MRPPTCGAARLGTSNRDYFLRSAEAHIMTVHGRFGGVSLKEAEEAVVGRGLEDGFGGVIGLDEKGMWR